jgi:hypothetical protein
MAMSTCKVISSIGIREKATPIAAAGSPFNAAVKSSSAWSTSICSSAVSRKRRSASPNAPDGRFRHQASGEISSALNGNGSSLPRDSAPGSPLEFVVLGSGNVAVAVSYSILRMRRRKDNNKLATCQDVANLVRRRGSIGIALSLLDSMRAAPGSCQAHDNNTVIGKSTLMPIEVGALQCMTMPMAASASPEIARCHSGMVDVVDRTNSMTSALVASSYASAEMIRQ